MLPPYVPGTVTPGKDLIHYSGPYWGEEEILAATQALREGRWISAGARVAAFERAFSRKFGHSDSLMVNSGSSANLVMLSAAKKYFGWEDGDEVLVSVVGFPTTVAPILQCGLTPVFCDIELNSLNFSLEEVEMKVTSRTRAIFVSPVLGNPPDMQKLADICLNEPLRPHLLLDGCDSLGSEFGSMPLSAWCSASSCSFYPAHHISTGEGGMVSSDDRDLIALARKFAYWGRDCWCVGANSDLPKGSCGKRFSSWLGEEVGTCDHKYVFSEIGYNLKPLDLQGAIGLEQLKRWTFIDLRRKEIKQKISSFLAKRRPDLHVPGELPQAKTSWFGVPVVCPSAEEKQRLVAKLESAKVQTRNYFAGNLLLHPGYRHLGDAADYPNANEVLARVFFVGCPPFWSDEVVAYVQEQFL